MAYFSNLSPQARRRTRLASALLAATFLASPAFAQGGPVVDESAEPEPEATIEEVVVTARFRREVVQDVPVAITAIGAKEIEAAGASTMAQFQQLAPSMQVFSFNARNTNINIRGLGSNVAVTNDGLDNGVGVYVDGVYYGRVGASQFDLVDLDRVEVLRGPQGTLFGKNTTAGAINISSLAPRFERGGTAEVSVGDYGYTQVRGSVTGPIIGDLLAGRLSISNTDRGGFSHNVRTGQDVHDYENFNVRGQLLFTPTETLKVRLIADYNKQQQQCCVSLPIAALTTYDNGAPIPNNVLQRLGRLGYTPLPFDPFARQTDADSEFHANMNAWGLSAQVDWDLGRVALTGITAYREWNWYPSNDIDTFGVPVFLQANQQNFQHQFSQEIRLASTGERKVDWVVGGYVFSQANEGVGLTLYGEAAPLWFLNPAVVPETTSTAALSGFGANSRSTPHTRSYAAFGQATWHATDRLALTGGLRYSYEKKWGEFTQTPFGPSLAGLPPATAAAAQAIRNNFAAPIAISARLSDDALSGTANIAYDFTDNVLGYATYSRGSKSGGLNLVALPAGVSPVVNPEKVDHYELGLKNQFFDRKLTLNLAAFWTEVGDYQTSIVDTDTSAGYRLYIANIDKVRSRGFEAEASFRAAEGVTIGASGAYVDATYLSYKNGACPPERLNLGRICDLSGQPLAGSPRFTGSLSLDVVRPVGELEAYGRADYSYRTRFFTAVNNSRFSQVDGYGIANLRLGVRQPDSLWDVSVWARNLFDEDYFQTRSVADTGLVNGLVGDPRTLGATLRTKF